MSNSNKASKKSIADNNSVIEGKQSTGQLKDTDKPADASIKHIDHEIIPEISAEK